MRNVYTVIGFLLFASLVVSTNAFAQQHPQYSLYRFNQAAYNPAAVGLDDLFSVTAQARYQWTGIDGAPLSQNLSAQLPLHAIKSDVGLLVLNNQQGLQRNTEAALQFNYRIRQRRTIWAVGVQGGVLQSALNGSKIITPDGGYDDGTVNHNDPILPESWTNILKPAFGAGLAVQSRRLKAGLSALYLNEPVLGLTTSEGPKVRRNYFSHLTYNFKVSRNVLVHPSLFFKYDMDDLQHEANVALQHNRLGWLGLGYRGFTETTRDAAYAFIGFRLSRAWWLAYSYDYTLSGLEAASYGSHEILLRYESPLSVVARPGKIIYTPRF
ncbi:MAG TPA: PorP/SprF family type IX secretion system membrane protein [Chitinophagales bacterium]|nr:PorP/SprF family type IX secretion system membrane protein [Chitinophagales bacterium]